MTFPNELKHVKWCRKWDKYEPVDYMQDGNYQKFATLKDGLLKLIETAKLI